MIKRATAGFVLATVLALVVAARSEPAARTTSGAPLLWQGRLGTHHVSLFGTIHVPDARVLALSAPVRGAFNRADRVVTENPARHGPTGGTGRGTPAPGGTAAAGDRR